ncbi:HPt (histidine-containing phosphotransfer) domain-containing protein [Marinobacter gudaonensis]|uniref:HPt (Histidine-containing phosphotransfer) domain-containing protein n=1 Tax=Marinobacter gudaonensis TaxID=375760 RepID=A0A1I6GI54_9GAMM|nr:Hpt domain-containing protein [Marinobacter gudaonensis]SFR41811.1 HPt (histidine-containing phosphotransfer) domain-containing protein [Marinobacter gudaonensis]
MGDKPHLDEEALAELQDVMEDEFEVLIQTYLADSRDRIHSLRQALEADDGDAFTKAAHSFKGSCINIGAPRLGELCLEAEKAGKASRLDEAPALLDAIDAEFRQVTQRLHALLVS